MKRREVGGVHLMLLLAVAVECAQVSDRAVMQSQEKRSIERTYELTKYLDHQLKEIKNTYLSYLGPPFSDPDFSPPRPNTSSLAVPSAATRVDLWRGLENGARLAQNQRAYSVLLCAVRELARSTLCPYLQNSLLHFCSGLSGLLGSISGLMNALGYTPPLHDNAPPSQKYAPLLSSQYQRASANGPTSLRSHASRNHASRSEVETGGVREEMERKRERAERGRKGRRREGESWAEREEEREEGLERWGRRRKLLAIEEEEEIKGRSYDQSYDQKNNNNDNNNNTHISPINYFSKFGRGERINSTDSQFPVLRGGVIERRISRTEEEEGFRESVPLLFSSPSLHPSRSGRSLVSPHGSLSPLSLLYPYEGDTLLATPTAPTRPALNDFTRKVEGFWVLRELQSWLWRSAKDFNRLKKRLRV